MPYDANTNEQEILKYWEENRIFEKSVDQRPDNKPFVFYDGPPFATGLPHYGHILSSVIKDVVPRYWTMRGYKVRRRWGWDCHGLPIESLIEKELKISGKKQIEAMGVDKFNEACGAKVLTYTKEWKKMVDRIGRWVEFDNAYKTMDPAYMESVWWSLKTIWDKGLIYEGRKVLMYCPRCETPVSKAEIAMDNSYKDITEETVTVKLRITNYQLRITDVTGPVFMLAWTTTPWTLPGNVALAVGAGIDYVVVKADSEYLILAKERIEAVLKGREFEIVKELKGSDLVGLEYEPLFVVPAVANSGKKAHYVAAADFVTTEEGTGVVHTACIYGEDDYNLGLKIDLPLVPLLDEKGVFNSDAPEIVRGQYFKKAEKDIKNDLERRGLLFKREQHTHSYPHCWRCDTQLFYNAISAWFIAIQRVKKRMIDLNERVNWFPDHLKHKRFLNILETAPDWNISRNRYWATPLPFWRCAGMEHGTPSMEHGAWNMENGTGCGGVVCIGSVKELKEKAVNFDEVFASDEVEKLDLHKHNLDKIKLKCDKCGGVMNRIPEVIDCWVESASMPFAEFHYPFENKAIFEARFPGHYIAEYIAQTRAWFYYMHAMAVLLFDDISFENVVCTGTIMNEKGEKLSKSKMNYTDPWVIIEKYGVDSLRYYLMTSVVMDAENLCFNDREVMDIYNRLVNMLWNVVSFYEMYALPVSAAEGLVKADGATSENILDKWILAKLQALIREVTDNMDNYNPVKAGRPIKEFVDDLSTWYVRRSRDRFKGGDKDDARFASTTLEYTLLTLAKVMAPFTPFIAEKIYLGLTGGKLKESVHLESWPVVNAKLADDEVLNNMEAAKKVVEIGLALRAESGLKVRQPLAELRITQASFHYAGQDRLRSTEELRTGEANYLDRVGTGELSVEYLGIIAEELNVKKVEFAEGEMIVESDVWKVKEVDGWKVGLNVELNEQLKKEGLVREIIRAINQIRKENKLTVADRVVVEYATADELLNLVFRENAAEIKQSVLAVELKTGGDLEMEISGIKVKIGVKKV